MARLKRDLRERTGKGGFGRGVVVRHAYARVLQPRCPPGRIYVRIYRLYEKSAAARWSAGVPGSFSQPTFKGTSRDGRPSQPAFDLLFASPRR